MSEDVEIVILGEEDKCPKCGGTHVRLYWEYLPYADCTYLNCVCSYCGKIGSASGSWTNREEAIANYKRALRRYAIPCSTCGNKPVVEHELKRTKYVAVPHTKISCPICRDRRVEIETSRKVKAEERLLRCVKGWNALNSKLL